MQKVVNAFENGIFLKRKQGEGLKSISDRKACITKISDGKISTVQQYCLYRANEVTKKGYNNITNSIKLYNRMDTIFMNSKNNETSNPHRLLLNLRDKINLKKSDKYFSLSNLRIYYYTWKNIKKSYKNNKFKISARTWNEELELPDVSYTVSDIQDYFECI